ITLPALPPSVTSDEGLVVQGNAYVYSDWAVRDDLILSFGLSANRLDGAFVDRRTLNPKFGLTWSPFDGTTIRAAAFKVTARTLVADQTIEPTQVAGFNQFFDDVEGTVSWRYGIGADQDFQALTGIPLFGGVEVSWRDLEVPSFVPIPVPSVTEQDFNEFLGRAYLYWTP